MENLWMWGHLPELNGEIFENYFDDIGQKNLFEGTTVDGITQNALMDYFRFDRLSAERKIFQWQWRRNLNMYYPIYKAQIEMWEERLTKEWFIDLQKTNKKIHEGTFHLKENELEQIIRGLKRAVEKIATGETDDTVTTVAELKHDGNTNTSAENEYTNNANSKDRAFSFAYPESNYQGGVIPYDLDDNPNVEFINSQGDSISKKDDTHKGSDISESNEEYSDNSTATETGKSITKNNATENTSDDETRNKEGGKEQNTETNWTETYQFEPIDLNTLVDQLINQLPLTNFWEQFVRKMRKVFQNIYVGDEVNKID